MAIIEIRFGKFFDDVYLIVGPLAACYAVRLTLVDVNKYLFWLHIVFADFEVRVVKSCGRDTDTVHKDINRHTNSDIETDKKEDRSADEQIDRL